MQPLTIPLNRIGRALRLCFAADLVAAVWGLRGWGKSQLIQACVPEGWGYYDFRLSDKEPSDIGGIPYPVDVVSETAAQLKHGRGLVQQQTTSKRVEYLMTKQLPFDCEEHCVINFEEIDRTPDMSTQNAMLQVTLDRSINGHKLSPNARLVCCGNGSTDIGTLPLSAAAAGRMVHFYVETQDESALQSWLDWAKRHTVSPHLQSFATYKQDVWTEAARKAAPLEEFGSPTPRTFVMADKLYQIARSAGAAHKKDESKGFETADLILPVVAGCVGVSAAREMLGWYKVCDAAPTLEEIEKAPTTARLPQGDKAGEELGVYFALGMTIARHCEQLTNGAVDRFASYIARWPDEQARFAFTHLLEFQPKAVTSSAYIKWEKQH